MEILDYRSNYSWFRSQNGSTCQIFLSSAPNASDKCAHDAKKNFYLVYTVSQHCV